MENVLCYYRGLIEEQPTQAYNITCQKVAINEYCNQVKKYNILKEYSEIFSGRSFNNRPEWQSLLNYIKSNKGVVNKVVFLTWDRFSRNISEALRMIEKLKKMNVEVECVLQPLSKNIKPEQLLLIYGNVSDLV
jgi:DNA invertase Pin-like site-specific DNA recombinase